VPYTERNSDKFGPSDQDIARAASCGHCNGGLIETWRGWRPSWKLADYNKATMGVIPCNCEAGLYAATNYSPWRDKPVHDREALRACAADAKRARAAYNGLAQGMICAPAFTRVAPMKGS
jgi:hypothetical protein